ncbi:carbon starvation protein A [Crassaminicella thermophila]|uniref:Carbon starvation protein A n=1 Tax=Crassaminicella thermophila TaxID=2599308 RepID=A0A5C0SET4_CRATE|nr:carbon starvation protein A [Crassaminicella thermophila]QEK13145.1 carbon starvation protein A [Crassaminicella thermophila]
MNSLWLILVSIIIFGIAYVTYGSWLAKQWGVDPTRKTPAHTKNDGVDYVPAKAPVLLGHHFASIAGAGPIVGPIAAAVFGWVPVMLWILIGGIFFGGVQDFGSLFASIRHDGRSIGEIIEANMGRNMKRLFSIFAWLTLLLVVAAFVNIVANTFVSVPAAASASVLFIILAVLFGFFVYRKGAPIGIASVIGVILLFLCIVLGNMFPLVLSKNAWIAILLGYIFIASVTPVWILLQPRDYLNSFLLYAMLIGAVLGLVFYRPTIQLPAFTGFTASNGLKLFPMLFVVVACGAISGFHSLVGSGTTSKQMDSEADAKAVGYGGMLIECVLAVIAIITAAYITKDKFAELAGAGGPVNVFSDGIGVFMSKFGIPYEIGKSFVALAVSAFALTSLDTGTRLGRFIFQEMFENPEKEKQSFLTNRFVATGITVVLGGWLALGSWTAIWPIFGSANQLLAALALITIAVWLKNSGKKYIMFAIPMTFMFIVTITALWQLLQANLAKGNNILVFFAVFLLVLAIVLAVSGIKVLRSSSRPKIKA